MIRMFMRHQVTDFADWRSHYDNFAAAREQLGVRGDAVFSGAEIEGDVTIWHDFDDMAAAQAFLNSSELSSAQQAAGVTGNKQIWFVNRDMPE